MIRIPREDWEEQGIIVAACSALFIYFLWQMSGRIGSQSASDVLHELFAVFVLPVSGYFSALTIIHFVSRSLPTIAWWIRGLLRWTFWWAVRVVIAAMATGVVASIIPGISGGLLMKSTIAIPTIYLIRHALLEYSAAHRRFGSLAQAERATYPKGHPLF